MAGGSPTSTPTSASAAASVPGARDLRFEALPGSPLPSQLTARGYIVTLIGESQRILPHAVVQKFEMSSSGALIAVTGNSTRTVSVIVTNVGIVTVERYDLLGG